MTKHNNNNNNKIVLQKRTFANLIKKFFPRSPSALSFSSSFGLYRLNLFREILFHVVDAYEIVVDRFEKKICACVCVCVRVRVYACIEMVAGILSSRVREF